MNCSRCTDGCRPCPNIFCPAICDGPQLLPLPSDQPVGAGIAFRDDRYVLHPGGVVHVGQFGAVGQAGLFAGGGVAFWIILILVLMLFSALLWAIIYCKPGCCACCARYAWVRYFFFLSGASVDERLVKTDAAHQADAMPLMSSRDGFSATYNYTLNVDQSAAAAARAASAANAANAMAANAAEAPVATADTWDKQAFAYSAALQSGTLASAAQYAAAPDANAYNSMRPSTYELNRLGHTATTGDEQAFFNTMTSRARHWFNISYNRSQ